MRSRRRGAFGNTRWVLAAALALAAALLAPACRGLSSGPKPPTAPDIVLVVIDALRADHLGCYGYERATDPSLLELARASTVFEQAFAAAPKTIPSIPQTCRERLIPMAT